MTLSINPCEQCLVFPICGDMCHAKINYGVALEVCVQKAIGSTKSLAETDYLKFKKLQVVDRDEKFNIELRARARQSSQ